MADVEMKLADDRKDEKKDEKPAEVEKKPMPLTPVAEIKANVVLIERAVSTFEPRFTHRVLRSLAHLRKKLDDKVLRDAIAQVYVTGEQVLSRCSLEAEVVHIPRHWLMTLRQILLRRNCCFRGSQTPRRLNPWM